MLLAAERKDLEAFVAIGREFGPELRKYLLTTKQNMSKLTDIADSAFHTMMTFREGTVVQNRVMKDIASKFVFLICCFFVCCLTCYY
jgi:hypothetical protein